MAEGPPYESTIAILGGRPSEILDVPICAVFLFLFLCGAIANMTIFRRNQARGHKFIPSALMFGFCMARIVTCSLRIAWACHLDNVRLSIAAGVFVAAGVLILFIINLLFAQRCLRAAHPKIGWSPIISRFLLVLYCLIPCMLVMVITANVTAVYTLDVPRIKACRDVLLVAGVYIAVFSFLPILIIALVIILPQRSQIESFGTGSWRTKKVLVVFSSVIMCLGATFRTGINFLDPRLYTDPYPVQSKAFFYIFNFGFEILVICVFVVFRVDRRFWVPNGSNGTYVQEMDKTGSTEAHELRVEEL